MKKNQKRIQSLAVCVKPVMYAIEKKNPPEADACAVFMVQCCCFKTLSSKF